MTVCGHHGVFGRETKRWGDGWKVRGSSRATSPRGSPRPEQQVLQRKGNKFFRVGASTMQGWRESMEDDHSIKLNLNKHSKCGFFGIFDGHCGKLASKYCGELMHKYIEEVSEITNTEEITKQIIKLDSDFMEKQLNAEDGSTAIFVVVKPSQDENGEVKHYNIVVGNIGDSRAVLGRNIDGVFNFTPLSEDHKPNNFHEQTRIVEAGGFVSLNRVRGNLALSRAIGDRSYKVPVGSPPEKLMVTCVPEYRMEVVSTSDFVLLACDGIYEGDIFTPESVIQFVSEKLQQSEDLAKITSELLDECVSRGSRDNMSAMIIQFKDGTSYNSENEYVPGIYHEGQRFNDFQNAYRLFAEQAGFTLEESRKLYEEKNKSQQF